MPRAASPRAAAQGVRETRVAVPCCSCSEPTSMKVPPALLDEIEILHLCTACARDSAPVKPPRVRPDGQPT